MLSFRFVTFRFISFRFGLYWGPLPVVVSYNTHHPERATRQPSQSKKACYCQGLVTAMAQHHVALRTSSTMLQDTAQQ